MRPVGTGAAANLPDSRANNSQAVAELFAHLFRQTPAGMLSSLLKKARVVFASDQIVGCAVKPDAEAVARLLGRLNAELLWQRLSCVVESPKEKKTGYDKAEEGSNSKEEAFDALFSRYHFRAPLLPKSPARQAKEDKTRGRGSKPKAIIPYITNSDIDPSAVHLFGHCRKGRCQPA
ncbi:MAG: hypothetical protein R3B47_03205 [Bacteroidia bacterium]